ncbi:ATP-dependent DNA ligase [Lysobacter korlensis]|uniref:DNA ligase (ATP) n=1 Tax=Lysobacter korlensis TaxID=553636 RepID=A0ABV6RZ23_9GAMM
MAGPANEQHVTVDQHRIRLTSLDKVMYPETGTTKAEVLDYYARVAHVLIPHAEYRPATRKRWVNGVGTADAPGQVFFEKNLGDGTPDWVMRRDIEHSSGAKAYPLINDRATLIWLAQLGALELHVPQWRFGRTGIRKNPDRMVLDLDPGEGAGLPECAEVARYCRTILTGMGLDPMPVTSGSKGIHLYAAVDGKLTSDEVSAVAKELARALEADHPDLVVSDMKKALRGGKVLVDWSQNNGNKTTIVPYSLRGRAHPMAAAPRTWVELDSPDLAHLTYQEVLARVESAPDPLAGLSRGHLASLEPTREHMATFQSTPEAIDRLAKYRSMRDASKTPEPVPEAVPATGSGNSFVIQEHHASRLHWDFRLEHEGVLVSWALPRGVPTDPKQNHLAVQTEDHPLEYGTFEGTIPKDEYGGGVVTIWDAGTYELEKWREGREVIATLHGEKHGTHKYALIHTGGRDGRDENNWLIHLMKTYDDPETPADSRTSDAKRRRVASEVQNSAKVSASTRPIVPMLATLGSDESLDKRVDWAFEMKWDGIRAIVEVNGQDLKLFTRNGNDVTATYPELAEVIDAVGAPAVLDGEIVALDGRGRPSFGRLQNRMNLTRRPDIERAMRDYPVHLLLFDLLEYDGESLLRTPYDGRRARLVEVVRPSKRVQVPPAFQGGLEAAIRSSRELGLEGIMAKDRRSSYVIGRRTSSWVKIKHHSTQEVIVVGWKPGQGRRSDVVGSLLLGIPDGHGLRYVGKVGTGFSDKDLDSITERLRPMETAEPAVRDVPRPDARDARWVSPELVAEVEFGEWTHTGRLRQPSWRGWRPDKKPGDVVLEVPA